MRALIGIMRRIVMLLLIAVMALAGAGTSVAQPRANDDAVTLRVMTFNIWTGGERVDFDQVAEAIRAADADIVGLQETDANLPRIAEELGWHYYPDAGRYQQIISRYPLVRSERPDVFLYAMVDDARVVAVSDVHLSAYPYGPYDLRDGMSVEDALAQEQRHLDELADHTQILPGLAEQGIPVFFTGDFNVPSHLDWTQAAAEASSEEFRTEIAWPVSTHLQELGLRDSFREIHPDEVDVPAYTWTPGYPPPEMSDDEVHDRIDYIYAAGPSTTQASAVVGEDSGISDVVVEPWPSDHRAVVSEFDVVPKPVAELDPLVATDSAAYDPGEPIEVDFLGADRGDRITVVKADRSTVPVRVVPTPGEAGTVVVGDDDAGPKRGPLEPGEYTVSLRGRDGIKASTTITVRDPAEQPTLTLDAQTYTSGQPVTATFTNAPGNATDWVGLYRVGETPGTTGSQFWQYVGGGQTPTEPVVDGIVTFSADTPGAGAQTWPPSPGDYVTYLFEQDGYRILAESTFTVE